MTDDAPRAEPLYFNSNLGSESRPLFGWLHRAATPAQNLGVVICNPFGHEAQCTHRSLRHWAQSAAQAGIPSLRFDYDGTGDSCGSDSDEKRVAAWTNSVQHAIETLKNATGVQNVALLGVRLGALLATLAALDNPEISALILVAPVVSGKAWLREMRALHGALALAETPADAAPLPENAREALGFLLTGETQKSLSEIDLLKLEKAPAPRVLLLDRDDLPGGAKLAAHFTALGAKVEHQTVPGYAEMMRDPHEVQVPSALIEATKNWLCAGAEAIKGPLENVLSASALITKAVQEAVQEHAVFLDGKKQLFGIVSVPQNMPQNAPQKAILFVNSGANHRTGPNRLYVQLARQLAERGFLVLRFDIAGLGDSWCTKTKKNMSFTPCVRLTMSKSAVRYVRQAWNISEVFATGICSGGYHAFKAALADADADAALNGVILINPLTFNWQPGDSLAIPNSQVIAEAQRYKQSALQADKWKNLLTGKTNPRVVAQFVGRRAADVAGRRVLNVAQKFGYRRSDDLGAALQSLAKRNIKLHFIFAEDDPGWALLQEQGGAIVNQLEKSGQLTIQRIAGPDHTFTPLWSHLRLSDCLAKTL